MSQQGQQLVLTPAPKFANFIVVDGTWKQKDSMMHVVTEDGDSLTINVSFFNPGVDATGELVVKTAQTPCVKGDVLSETAPSTVKWLVLEVENSNYGGRPLKQAVQLMRKTSLTLS